LLDVVIQVTNADKGFNCAGRVREPVVKVARNLRHEPSRTPVSHLSDAILARVMATKKPLNHLGRRSTTPTLRIPLSVMNLRLTSVMWRTVARARQLDRDDLCGHDKRGPTF